MAEPAADAAHQHLPSFITAPGETDTLMVFIVVFLLVIVVTVGVLYFRLHALPEHMAHRSQSTQLQLVGVLALLALFTHNNIFWVAALLLAAFRMPDFLTPINSIARSLATATGRLEAEERMGAIERLEDTPGAEDAAAAWDSSDHPGEATPSAPEPVPATEAQTQDRANAADPAEGERRDA